MKIETRGPQEGICNLCGKHSRLTEDHIPPKGCPKVGQARLMEIMAFLGQKQEKKTGRFFQRGVKYRSICSNCNSVLLGHHYDPELIQFSNTIKVGLESKLYLPIEIETRQNRLIRSVVGHLIAHGIELYKQGTMYEELTDYFMSPHAAWPSNLQLHFWPYPSNDQVVIRGSASLSIRKGEHGFVFALLKFFPVAFMITIGEPRATQHQSLRLDQLLTEDLEDKVCLSIPISLIPPTRWPEAPDDYSAVLHTDNSYGAMRT